MSVAGLVDWPILVIVPEGPATKSVGATAGREETAMASIAKNSPSKLGKHAIVEIVGGEGELVPLIRTTQPLSGACWTA